MKITLAQSRCLNTDTSRDDPNMYTFTGASCVTTSTLSFYTSFRPRHVTSSQISEPRVVLLLHSSSIVLFFVVVFDSIVVSRRSSSPRRLSLLRTKWFLTHNECLVLSVLSVSSTLYFYTLFERGGWSSIDWGCSILDVTWLRDDSSI